jgi:hypothetical protein
VEDLIEGRERNGALLPGGLKRQSVSGSFLHPPNGINNSGGLCNTLLAKSGRSKQRPYTGNSWAKTVGTALDPTLAEAHVALGWLELNDWDFAGADRGFKPAIALNPNLVVARIWYAPLRADPRFLE